MISVAVELLPPDGTDHDAVANAVGAGLATLFGQLALPIDAELSFSTTPGTDENWASVNGLGLTQFEVDSPFSSADRYNTAVIAAVTSGREVLATTDIATAILDAAGRDPSSVRARWAIFRTVRLGVRVDRVLPYLDELASWGDYYDAIAAAAAPTDDTPFRIAIPHDTPGASSADELQALNDQVRMALFAATGVAMRSSTTASEAVPPGTAVVTIRDVTYPPLPVAAVSDEAEPIAGSYLSLLARIGGRNIDAAVTPRYVDMVLAHSQLALPVATNLARARWPENSLIEALRTAVLAMDGPRELPFLMERLGLVGPDTSVPPEMLFIPLAAVDGLPVADDSPPTVGLRSHHLFA